MAVPEGGYGYSDGNGEHKAVPVSRLRLTFADLRWLLVLIFAGIAWGLKLELRIDGTGREITVIATQHGALEERIEHLEREVEPGVLPRADERLSTLERAVEELWREQERQRQQRQ